MSLILTIWKKGGLQFLQQRFFPMRYRGYVYDQETGFYYLNNRYYDPAVGRFISVDDEISGIGGEPIGYNLFGRLIDSQQLDGSNIVIRTNQAYNSSNQMTKQSWQVGGDSYAQDFTYNSSDGSLNTFAISRNGSELTKFTI